MTPRRPNLRAAAYIRGTRWWQRYAAGWQAHAVGLARVCNSARAGTGDAKAWDEGWEDRNSMCRATGRVGEIDPQGRSITLSPRRRGGAELAPRRYYGRSASLILIDDPHADRDAALEQQQRDTEGATET